jgi:multiple sugar transport system substrate-binding protein
MLNVEGGAGRRPIQHSAFNIQHSTLLLVLSLSFLLSCSRSTTKTTTIEFWGLGREGEVVAEFVPEFERLNPGIKVDVQQIPWTAAHEKMLTAHVGNSVPDIAQMGNTWIPEFVTIDALEPLDGHARTLDRGDYFEGIWETNVVGTTLYGIPWYVDTRVLFYNSAMIPTPPRTWSEWMATMERLKRESGRSDFYPILLPTNEWPQPVILAVQQHAPLLAEDATAQFTEPRFLSAFDFYLDIYRRGLAPVVGNNQVANLYSQFAEGEFAMFITGPWNVGEMRRRLPAAMQSKWATAPMPAPDGTPYPGLSLAGGSSLVIFKNSERKAAAWKFIEFLSQPERQARFYEASGDLPARKSAWNAPLLANDDKLPAFRVQLDHTAPLPRVPEWEYIATTIFEQGDIATRKRLTARQAGEALNVRVNRILAKRRWVLARKQHPLTGAPEVVR